MTIQLFEHMFQSWQILFALGILLASLEVFVPGFILLPIGIGFITSALFAPFITSFPLLLVVIAANLALVLYVMNRFIRPLVEATNINSNAAGMIGKEAVVIKAIAPNEQGEVKLYGDTWRAVSSEQVVMEVGSRVLIDQIDGNKVHVALLKV